MGECVPGSVKVAGSDVYQCATVDEWKPVSHQVARDRPAGDGMVIIFLIFVVLSVAAIRNAIARTLKRETVDPD